MHCNSILFLKATDNGVTLVLLLKFPPKEAFHRSKTSMIYFDHDIMLSSVEMRHTLALAICTLVMRAILL